MNLPTLLEHIGIPQDAIRRHVPEDEECRLHELFVCNEPAFYQELDNWRDRAVCYENVLYLYTRWAVAAYDMYRAAGLTDDIYYDNFRDLGIWYQVCHRTTGVSGIERYHWVSKPLKMEIFRLGRLQFEPGVAAQTVSIDGFHVPGGTPVLHVHIPEGGNLSPEDVAASFAQSRRFFPRYCGRTYQYYDCESWLLARENHLYMREDSNILRFREWFHVYGEDYGKRQAEERVFGWQIRHPEEYPEETSLQRSLKAFLLSGGSVGMGLGIGRFDTNE